jgi:hypothetical protein
MIVRQRSTSVTPSSDFNAMQSRHGRGASRPRARCPKSITQAARQLSGGHDRRIADVGQIVSMSSSALNGRVRSADAPRGVNHRYVYLLIHGIGFANRIAARHIRAYMGRERCILCDWPILPGDDTRRAPEIGLLVHRACYLRDQDMSASPSDSEDAPATDHPADEHPAA